MASSSAEQPREIEASVVIPTHNRVRILQRVLERITKQSYPPERFEVLVVDDGSSDGTQSMVASRESAPALRYLYQSRSGPAAARNYGIREARGEIIIFLDSDIQVNRDFVAAHVSMHREEENLVGRGVVINTDNQEDPFAEKKKLTDLSTAFFATGNVSTRRKHLIRAGLFDEEFHEYGWEDLELGVRLKKLGLTVVSVTGAVGYHYYRKPSVAELPEVWHKERMRGRMAVRFYRKHPTFEVKCMTHMSGVFFALDRLLNLGDWMGADALLERLQAWEKKGVHLRLSIAMALVRSHAYLEGAREVLCAKEAEKA